MSASFHANVVDDNGTIQPASSVEIKDESGALIPHTQIFFDKDHTTNIGANPFTTDSQGKMDFFIDAKIVNITAQKGAFTRTWTNEVLNELIDSDEFAKTADLGTAAFDDSGDFATASQGTLADSATQPGDLGNIAGDNKTSAGAVVFDTGNYQPEISLGVGVVRLMKNNSGVAISNESTTAGSNLNAIVFSSSGAFTQSVATGSGVWVNVGGAACSSGSTREFARVS